MQYVNRSDKANNTYTYISQVQVAIPNSLLLFPKKLIVITTVTNLLPEYY